MVLAGIGKPTLAALIISEIKRASTVDRLNLSDLAELMNISTQSASKKLDSLRLKNSASGNSQIAG
jgi:DNA-binding MarR family transcriptional regulator